MPPPRSGPARCLAPSTSTDARGPGTAVAQNGVLPLAQSRVEVEVDDLVDEFTPSTRRNLQQVLGGLGTGFASRGQDFNDSFSALRPLVKDSHTVFGEIAAPSTQLDRLLHTYTATADELAAKPENLAGILESGPPRCAPWTTRRSARRSRRARRRSAPARTPSPR